jgi:multiple sugar transport system ATP-binding protein
VAKVQLNDITKIFRDRSRGEVYATKDVNLTVRDGEFAVLVGPSGCGKTTTLRMIAGLEKQTYGDIYIGDRLVNKLHPKERDIAMVFQDYALYPHMSVYENMSFGLQNLKVPRREIEEKVKYASEMLSIANLLDRRPRELSGGQRQRVALGRAIVRSPQVFLFDEPLSNLDAKLRVQMRVELTELHKRLGTTMIYVTHDQVEAMTLGERIVVMNGGLIQQIDDPRTLYDRPTNTFVAGFIGAPPMNFFDGALALNEGAHFMGAGFAVALPPDLITRHRLHDGQRVVLGVRPEDISMVAADSAPGQPGQFSATVRVVEYLGSEMLIYFALGDKTYIARMDPHAVAVAEGTVQLRFGFNRLSFFDPQTEQRIGTS